MLLSEKSKMKKIGITGGIGSGKSTVCEIFKLLGVPVFHADLEAKNLQDNDIQIKNAIIERFGTQFYTQEGVSDRKRIAAIIFNDQEALTAMNEIIHPAVWQRFLRWSEDYRYAPYLLFEAAILFESGFASNFERNILILADEKVRIERVIKRDCTTEAAIKQRIANQLSDNEKIHMADYIIENNQENLLLPLIVQLDKLIRENGKNW